MAMILGFVQDTHCRKTLLYQCTVFGKGVTQVKNPGGVPGLSGYKFTFLINAQRAHEFHCHAGLCHVCHDLEWNNNRQIIKSLQS